MLLYRTLGKVSCTNMRKNMYVVTPRCAAAAAVVSAVVLRRPTKEYTHPYSMMHRRFSTAGIEVAPHYHQLLVVQLSCVPVSMSGVGARVSPRFDGFKEEMQPLLSPPVLFYTEIEVWKPFHPRLFSFTYMNSSVETALYWG